MKEGRIMALDVGDVRTGVAVTDPLQMIASPHSVVQAPSLEATIAELAALVAQFEPVLIVVGHPLDQHGEPGPQALRVQRFVARLRQVVETPIILQDERFSTASAQRSLRAAGMRRGKAKGRVDQVAAANILQDYLARQG